MDIVNIVVVVVAVLFLISLSAKVVAEYERGVIFRLGKLIGAKGPVYFSFIPLSIVCLK
jgi:regulator of protease activity HflC (stomatin/prohibitin superfamily)